MKTNAPMDRRTLLKTAAAAAVLSSVRRSIGALVFMAGFLLQLGPSGAVAYSFARQEAQSAHSNTSRLSTPAVRMPHGSAVTLWRDHHAYYACQDQRTWLGDCYEAG